MSIRSAGILQSPIGLLRVEAKDDFITEIKFEHDQEDEKVESSEVVNHCIKQLEEYFQQQRKEFQVPVDPDGTEFEKEVWSELMKIPVGTTISYEELSNRLGDIRKIRAAGRANGKNPIPIIIPCHRVIGKDGSLVGYAGGLHRKEWLLIHEGVISEQIKLF